MNCDKCGRDYGHAEGCVTWERLPVPTTPPRGSSFPPAAGRDNWRVPGRYWTLDTSFRFNSDYEMIMQQNARTRTTLTPPRVVAPPARPRPSRPQWDGRGDAPEGWDRSACIRGTDGRCAVHRGPLQRGRCPTTGRRV